MNISPINNTNTSFNGKIITKGTWPGYLKKNFIENPEIIKLASGDSDIVGKMLYRKAIGFFDKKHYPGQNTFKLKIYAQNEKPTLKEKLINFLGLNKTFDVTRHFHSIYTTERMMDLRIKADKIKNALGI